MTEKEPTTKTSEKEQMALANRKRNQHVLEVHEEAGKTTSYLIGNGYTRADVILFGKIITEIGDRFD